MWRTIIVALALICLGLLGWYAVRKYPKQIERDLQARVQKVIDQRAPGATAKVTDRDAELVLPAGVDKVAIEREIADLSGIKSVRSQVAVVATPEPEVAAPGPRPEPEPAALLELDITWTGTSLMFSGKLPKGFRGELDQRLVTNFDTETLTVGRQLTETEGTPPEGGSAALQAALDALSASLDGKVRIVGKTITASATVENETLAARVKSLVAQVGGTITVTIRVPVPDADVVGDATPSDAGEVTGDVSVLDMSLEEPGDAGPTPDAVSDAKPADAAPAEVAPTKPTPGDASPLSAKECKDRIQAMVEGPNRITFLPNTGRLTPEGDVKVVAIWGVLQRCPTAKGVIEGYHDDYGDPDKLKLLTYGRALGVQRRLVELGMEKARFKIAGLGYRNMRYGGKADTRVLNQRVEFNIKVD
jgi:outer membrane protein OmpA-like peptidoglycan-associated protein